MSGGTSYWSKSNTICSGRGGEFVWDKRATENKPFHLTINICYSQLTPGVTAFYHKRTSKGWEVPNQRNDIRWKADHYYAQFAWESAKTRDSTKLNGNYFSLWCWTYKATYYRVTETKHTIRICILRHLKCPTNQPIVTSVKRRTDWKCVEHLHKREGLNLES